MDLISPNDQFAAALAVLALSTANAAQCELNGRLTALQCVHLADRFEAMADRLREQAADATEDAPRPPFSTSGP